MSAKYKFSSPAVKQRLIFWLIIIAATSFDLWSKAAVFDYLGNMVENGSYYEPQTQREGKPIAGEFITFILRENSGAAFSIARGQKLLLRAVSIAGLLLIVVCFEVGKIKSGLQTIIAALFAAGICGNLYDRLFNDGLVRDFIDVNLFVYNYHWPTFNVADALMCVAIGLYILVGILEERRAKNETDN